MSGSSKRFHHGKNPRNQNDSRNCGGIIRGLEAIQRQRLSFAGGENKEVAEKFLSRLKRCKISAQISDSDMLAVVSSALVDDAYFWFSANEKRFRNWQHFERLFAKHFIGNIDEDAMDKIHGRKQAREEKLTHFLSDMKSMMQDLFVSLSSRRQVKIALRNLRSSNSIKPNMPMSQVCPTQKSHQDDKTRKRQRNIEKNENIWGIIEYQLLV